METKKVVLSESVIPEMYYQFIDSNTSGAQRVNVEYVPSIYSGIVEGLALAVKDLKDKDAIVGVIVRDRPEDGAFLFGVKIKFIAGDSEDAGSWNTIWSFNPADFEEDVDKKYYLDSANGVPEISIRSRLNAAGLAVFPQSNIPYLLTKTAFKILISWLDTNAKEDEQVVISHPGKFDATIDVIEGVKIMNFIPDEEVTNIAKSDSDI